jgi:ribonuclease P protein component
MAGKFRKSQRLRLRRDFDRLYQQGRLLQDDYFRIQYSPRAQSVQPARLGLTVGKDLGKAAQRNRIKRVLREIFRQHAELCRGLDLVVQPKPALAALPNVRIRERFLAALQALRARVPKG